MSTQLTCWLLYVVSIPHCLISVSVFQNGESPCDRDWPRYHLLLCGGVPAWQGGNHRQWPGQPDHAVLRGLHGHGAADRGRRQEPGGHEPQQHGVRWVHETPLHPCWLIWAKPSPARNPTLFTRYQCFAVLFRKAPPPSVAVWPMFRLCGQLSWRCHFLSDRNNAVVMIKRITNKLRVMNWSFTLKAHAHYSKKILQMVLKNLTWGWPDLKLSVF